MELVHRIVPPRTPSPKPPLLVFLHGIGADEDDLLPLAGAMDPRFLVVSARAPHPEPPGYRWYEIDWTRTPPAGDATEMTASRELLARFLEAIVAREGADPSRVFLLGFSQGAIMALALLLARPELVRGVVAHSGMLSRLPGGEATVEALSEVEVLLLHGEEDPVIPAAEGRRAQQALAAILGPRVTFLGFSGAGHYVTQASLSEAARWLGARLDGAQ